MAKNNEAKIRFTAETGEFNSQIKKSNSEMAKLRSEMKLNAEQMKTTGATVEGLEQKQKLLGSQLDAAKAKTEALNGKVEAAKRIFGENSDEVANLEKKLIEAQTAEVKIERAISNCNAELQAQQAAANKAESAFDQLSDEIDNQQGDLDELKRKYSDVVLEQGKSSKEAKDLAREIKELSGELKDNKSKMSAAENAADKLDKSLDNAGDGASGAGDGFTVMKGALSDLVSEGIQFAIGKFNELIDFMWGLPEETREIRQDFATLNTAFEKQGHSAEQAELAWKDLYAVIGEDDRAIETANHIAKISKNQEDLNKWVTITQGVWGTYQDSLPVEGLAEAVNETIKVGTVTGVLADALNWAAKEGETFGVEMADNIEFTKLSDKELSKLTASQRTEYEVRKAQSEEIDAYNKKVAEATSAEDFFNLALEGCTTEQERQQMIMDTLSGMYGQAAADYEEASGAQIDAKLTTAETVLAQNDLANAIEPVTTAWQDMKNQLLVGVLPVVEKVSDWAIDALEWMKEHPKLVTVITTTLGIFATALSGLAIGWGVYTAAQWLANSAMLACPVTWIVLAIAAVIAAIVALVVYWDEISAAITKAWDAIKNTLSQWGTWIYDNVIAPVVDFFKGLWDGIVGVFKSVVDWVKNNWQSIVLFLINPFAGIFKYLWDNCEVFRNFLIGVGQWIYDNVITPVVDFFVGLWNSIVDAWHTVVDPWIEIVRRLSVIFYESVILPVAQFFTDLWNDIVTGLQAAWDWIVGIALTVAGWVNENVVQPVANFFVELWNKITTGVSNAVKWVKDIFATISNWVNTKVIQPVAGFFTKLWDGFTNGARKAWDGVKSVFSAVGGFFSKVFNVVKDKIVSVFQAGGKVFNNIKDGIVNVFKTVVNGIIRGINSVIKLPFQGLNKILDTIHGVTIVGVQPFSWLTWRAPIPKIPLLAEGGILTQPTLNIAGEAGAEAVIPLDRLQSFIDTAVDRSLQANNLAALVYAVEDLANRAIELNINGHKFATATAADSDRVNGSRMTLSKMGLALG